uniref:Uncharacterized protein n=1 Tax=Plectus sambesii TaxID=2011161 RepID=A0A914W3Q9_9BILA
MRFKDRRAKQRRTVEEKEVHREKVREKKQRQRAAPVDLIVVEDLNLTPPLQVAAVSTSRQDAIEQHEEITDMVVSADEPQPRRLHRRKDIHPPAEKRKAPKADEDGENEIVMLPNPDNRSPRKQLTPSTAERRRARVQMRLKRYAEKQRARKSYGAEGSDHRRRAALQVHSNRCQTTVAKADSSGRRTNTEYWRSKYRLLRKKRVFGLTENYLAQFNLKRQQKTKRMAERKMAKLYSTADEIRRVVQSDLHVMLQRFYKNNVSS